MKIRASVIILTLFCVIPATAYSHPGKTDQYGGHKCMKDCEEWKLYYKEYHLHDKDGKAIRTVKKPKKREMENLVSAFSETAVPVQTEPPLSIQTVTVYQYVTVSNEEISDFQLLLWILLILLLLLLILRLGRRQPRNLT